MASVVGKTIFSDGKGKLFFGYYKTDDAVEFVDYKTWKKLSFKDVSKGNTNKERVIKAILKNQKQFNKKVDFNMWAKKNKPSFEQTMDWFIQNGWINNINKGGIKESVDVLSVNEAKYKVGDTITVIRKDGMKYKGKVEKLNPLKLRTDSTSTVVLPNPTIKKVIKESVNEGKFKPSQVRSAISKVKKELMRKWKQKGGYENFGQKELHQLQNKFDYNAYGDKDEREISHMLDDFNRWAMNYDGNMREGKKRYYQLDRVGSSKYTINYHDGKKKHKDGSDFFDIQIFKNKKDLAKFVNALHKNGYVYGFDESINEDKTKESKIVQNIYKYTPKEKQFYDKMAEHERRIGPREYAKFIIMALKGFGINPREFKRIPDAEEKLYQTVSQK